MSTLWNEHEDYLVPLPDPYAIRWEEAHASLAAIRDLRPGALRYRPLGHSVEGREIVLAEIGDGPITTLAWSQMHGDEPTHTAVLLDLLHFLQRRPDHPTAAAILKHLRLAAIVMLNPDGAERQTRQNAQGIDINRDARALASPEARLLHQAVCDLQPNFAFNLHNHNPRRTVAATGEPAAVALLTPPIDDSGSCPTHMVAAQQVASWVRQAVETHAPGMVARYEADYMPRAFGEWVQQQGAATLLIEAGGWSTLPAESLRRLHFVALTAALSGIATGDYRRVDASLYRSLPGAGDVDLFDLTIIGGQIATGPQTATSDGRPSWEADLGINAAGIRLQGNDVLREATIAAIGDLHTTRGKTIVDAHDAVCLPGRVAWRRDVTPERWPTREEQQASVRQGATTLLGTIDLTLPEPWWQQLAEALRRPPAAELLQNLGWVAAADIWSDREIARLAMSVPHGVVAIVDRELPRDVGLLADAWQIVRIPHADADTHGPAQLVDVALPGRSGVALGAVADLAIADRTSCDEHLPDAAYRDLRQVIVGGTVVLNHGDLLDVAPGVLLSGR